MWFTNARSKKPEESESYDSVCEKVAELTQLVGTLEDKNDAADALYESLKAVHEEEIRQITTDFHEKVHRAAKIHRGQGNRNPGAGDGGKWQKGGPASGATPSSSSAARADGQDGSRAAAAPLSAAVQEKLRAMSQEVMAVKLEYRQQMSEMKASVARQRQTEEAQSADRSAKFAVECEALQAQLAKQRQQLLKEEHRRQSLETDVLDMTRRMDRAAKSESKVGKATAQPPAAEVNGRQGSKDPQPDARLEEAESRIEMLSLELLQKSQQYVDEDRKHGRLREELQEARRQHGEERTRLESELLQQRQLLASEAARARRFERIQKESKCQIQAQLESADSEASAAKDIQKAAAAMERENVELTGELAALQEKLSTQERHLQVLESESRDGRMLITEFEDEAKAAKSLADYSSELQAENNGMHEQLVALTKQVISDERRREALQGQLRQTKADLDEAIRDKDSVTLAADERHRAYVDDLLSEHQMELERVASRLKKQKQFFLQLDDQRNASVRSELQDYEDHLRDASAMASAAWTADEAMHAAEHTSVSQLLKEKWAYAAEVAAESEKVTALEEANAALEDRIREAPSATHWQLECRELMTELQDEQLRFSREAQRSGNLQSQVAGLQSRLKEADRFSAVFQAALRRAEAQATAAQTPMPQPQVATKNGRHASPPPLQPSIPSRQSEGLSVPPSPTEGELHSLKTGQLLSRKGHRRVPSLDSIPLFRRMAHIATPRSKPSPTAATAPAAVAMPPSGEPADLKFRAAGTPGSSMSGRSVGDPEPSESRRKVWL
eukprot:TRINITY_DN100402_c0_g1_i1.p1 TRINITY_DN100402_c0_g1~~TRINITY_DN100402_c0_g1_i1.p1  ORF type:complete len:791 (+),score=276.03 TRINITY_DN100402_c0_g1_i1:90-2462(+)